MSGNLAEVTDVMNMFASTEKKFRKQQRQFWTMRDHCLLCFRINDGRGTTGSYVVEVTDSVDKKPQTITVSRFFYVNAPRQGEDVKIRVYKFGDEKNCISFKYCVYDWDDDKEYEFDRPFTNTTDISDFPSFQYNYVDMDYNMADVLPQNALCRLRMTANDFSYDQFPFFFNMYLNRNDMYNQVEDDINNQMPGASNKERDAMFAEQDINFNLPANFSLDVKPLNFSTSFNVNFLKQLGRNGKGELGFFRYTGTVVPPYLAYLTANFIIDDDTPSKYCMFSIDDTIDSDLFDEQPTSITTAQQPTQGVSGTFYDITGRPLPGKPSKPGVYIFKGKKIVIP